MHDSSSWQPLHILTAEQITHLHERQQLADPEPNRSVHPALFVVDLSNESYSTPPTHVLTTLESRTALNCPGLSAITLRDTLVFGSHHFHAFISSDGMITSRGLTTTGSQLDFHIRSQNTDGFSCPRFRQKDEHYEINCASMPPASVTHLSGRSYFASPREPANWGMWLVQGLPDLMYYVQTGGQATLLGWFPGGFQDNLASFCGVNRERLMIQHPWRGYQCEELRLLQYDFDGGLCLNRHQRSVFSDVVERCQGTAPPTAEKLFISRKSVHATYRALVNEDELCSALASLGYTIIEPQYLTFKEQVKLFNSARVVVGLGGAGMFNAVFCRPGTVIVSIESSAAFIPNHAALFSSLDLPYGIILGERDINDPNPVHYRWRVDISTVVSLLSKL